jgi:hypothetical protein
VVNSDGTGGLDRRRHQGGSICFSRSGHPTASTLRSRPTMGTTPTSTSRTQTVLTSLRSQRTPSSTRTGLFGLPMGPDRFRRDGRPEPAERWVVDLFVMNSDGTGTRQLTRNAGLRSRVRHHLAAGLIHFPWNAMGQELRFLSGSPGRAQGGTGTPIPKRPMAYPITRRTALLPSNRRSAIDPASRSHTLILAAELAAVWAAGPGRARSA